MNSQQQQYIVDHIGAENWEQVEAEFSGKSVDEITEIVDGMFREDNTELIDAICAEFDAEGTRFEYIPALLRN